MSYREKLEKYKKNQLPEEEKKKVEDEIEKAEAINEYLADKLEEELIEDDEAFQDGNEENTFHEEKDSRMEEKEAQFEEYVKKSIHRIFQKNICRNRGSAPCGPFICTVRTFPAGIFVLL